MRYARPPIVEAVVNFNFPDLVSAADIAKATQRPPKGYTQNAQELEIQATIEAATGNIQQSSRPIGARLTSFDATEILIVQEHMLIVSAMAPYPGWDNFVERVFRDLAWHREKFGTRRMGRIGVRFINRLDIPLGTAPSEYLNIVFALPGVETSGVNSYSLTTSFQLPGDGWAANISTGTAVSPVPLRAGLIFDLDIYIQNDEIPMKVDQLAVLLSEMRQRKNDIFEALITDKARELFSK